MVLDWIVVTSTIIFITYLMVMMFYYKSLAIKDKTRYAAMKLSLEEAELLIRKYHMQLQRAMGNIDMMSEELSMIRTELQNHKAKASSSKFENEGLRKKVAELEQKVEALI